MLLIEVSDNWDVCATSFQAVFNKQFSQRYRNNRRISRHVTTQKVFLPTSSTSPSTGGAAQVSSGIDEDMENYEENTRALKNFFKDAILPLRQVDATRSMRKQWLLSPSISIQDIVKKFLIFSHSKWV